MATSVNDLLDTKEGVQMVKDHLDEVVSRQRAESAQSTPRLMRIHTDDESDMVVTDSADVVPVENTTLKTRSYTKLPAILDGSPRNAITSAGSKEPQRRLSKANKNNSSVSSLANNPPGLIKQSSSSSGE